MAQQAAATRHISLPSAPPPPSAAAAPSFPAGLPVVAAPPMIPIQTQAYVQKMAVDASAMLQVINRLGMAFQGTVSGAPEPTLHCLTEWRAHIGDTPIPGTKVQWEGAMSPPPIVAAEMSVFPGMYHAETTAQEPEIVGRTAANELQVPLTARGRIPTDERPQPSGSTSSRYGVHPTFDATSPSKDGSVRNEQSGRIQGEEQQMVRVERRDEHPRVQELKAEHGSSVRVAAVGLVAPSISTPASLEDGELRDG